MDIGQRPSRNAAKEAMARIQFYENVSPMGENRVGLVPARSKKENLTQTGRKRRIDEHLEKDHNEEATENKNMSKRNRMENVPLKSGYHQLKDYGCLRIIGEGRFAEVFSGTDPESRQPVALKKTKLTGLDSNKYGLMHSEVRNLALLRHSNIVKLHRWFKHEEQMPPGANPPAIKYLMAVMELFAMDLEGFIQTKSEPPVALLDEPLIWHLFEEMCEGVKYMHSRDYIHRDLKPANILVSRCLRTVKLADFGLTRKARHWETVTTFTGTPLYMAPERIARVEYGKPSDVWSLGCILYELTTLRSPFDGDGEYVNLDSLDANILIARYAPIPEDVYSNHLLQIVGICLAHDPAQRPSAAELTEAAIFMNKKLSWLTSSETVPQEVGQQNSSSMVDSAARKFARAAETNVV